MSKEPKLAAANAAHDKFDKSLRKWESLRKLWVNYFCLHPSQPFTDRGSLGKSQNLPATDCASVKWG